MTHRMVSKSWIGAITVVIVAIAAIGAWYILSTPPPPPPKKENFFRMVIIGEDLASSIDPCIAMTTHETFLMVQIYDPLFMPDPD